MGFSARDEFFEVNRNRFNFAIQKGAILSLGVYTYACTRLTESFICVNQLRVIRNSRDIVTPIITGFLEESAMSWHYNVT